MASPNFWFRPLAPALAALGLLAAASGAMAQTAAGTNPAQTPQVDASEGFGSNESGGAFGDNASPFDIIHRAVLMNGITMEDYNRQQRGHLNNEAANFRALQQEALQQQAESQVVEEAIQLEGQ